MTGLGGIYLNTDAWIVLAILTAAILLAAAIVKGDRS